MSAQKAVYHARLQKITAGRVKDLKKAYQLACNPNVKLDPGLMLFKDGEHAPAIERVSELGFIGNLGGIVIGIGGADPPGVLPEQILPAWKESSKSFFDLEKNKFTYFQRMLVLREVLHEEGLPAERIDIIPKYPHHYYPTVFSLFEDPDSRAFQYLGVESNHHLNRIQTKEPGDRNIIVLYHDYRDLPAKEKEARDVHVKSLVEIEDLDDKLFYLFTNTFMPLNGECAYGPRIERALDKMLIDAKRFNRDAVLAITCFPRQEDREMAEKHFKKPYKELCPLSPLEVYNKLKNYLLKKGVSLNRTHITFSPPDRITGRHPSRSESYLPREFIEYSTQVV